MELIVTELPFMNTGEVTEDECGAVETVRSKWMHTSL